ncbi:hypothetical protein cand_014160 [Cryptosporidium andersoni]|uniref:SAC3/GANP/THP3 conserved domain-containing protein n=1 Tax=Cryptosporidium andersoni TaxID=117008 RepID=A0A1J4MU38_9CRYT|nr:hypothetical protein cand_014160 [Cryptosporidium andersoni]
MTEPLGGKNRPGRDIIYPVPNQYLPPTNLVDYPSHPLLNSNLFENPLCDDARQLFIIQDPAQLQDSMTSTALVGKLMSMCSQEEVIDKQKTSTANDLERLPGVFIEGDIEARIVNPNLAVKSFQRSDASRVFHASLVRPVLWCRRVVRSLITYFIDADHLKLPYLYPRVNSITNSSPLGYQYIDIYNFLRDRLRAVWQDLTVQHANKHRGFLESFEVSFRFLVLSEELLCNIKEFNSVQNGSLMSTCLDKLMSGYNDVHYFYSRTTNNLINDKFLHIIAYVSPFEAEFWCYRILTSMSLNSRGTCDTRIIDIMARINPMIKNHILIKLSLEIHQAFRLGNAVRYFKYLENCLTLFKWIIQDKLQSEGEMNIFYNYKHCLILIAILLKKYSNVVRVRYLNVLLSSHLLRRQGMPVHIFFKQFGFYLEDIQAFKVFCQKFNISLIQRVIKVVVPIQSIQSIDEVTGNSSLIVSFASTTIPNIESLDRLRLTQFPSPIIEKLLDTSIISRRDILDPIFDHSKETQLYDIYTCTLAKKLPVINFEREASDISMTHKSEIIKSSAQLDNSINNNTAFLNQPENLPKHLLNSPNSQQMERSNEPNTKNQFLSNLNIIQNPSYSSRLNLSDNKDSSMTQNPISNKLDETNMQDTHTSMDFLAEESKSIQINQVHSHSKETYNPSEVKNSRKRSLSSFDESSEQFNNYDSSFNILHKKKLMGDEYLVSFSNESFLLKEKDNTEEIISSTYLKGNIDPLNKQTLSSIGLQSINTNILKDQPEQTENKSKSSVASISNFYFEDDVIGISKWKKLRNNPIQPNESSKAAIHTEDMSNSSIRDTMINSILLEGDLSLPILPHLPISPCRIDTILSATIIHFMDTLRDLSLDIKSILFSYCLIFSDIEKNQNISRSHKICHYNFYTTVQMMISGVTFCDISNDLDLQIEVPWVSEATEPIKEQYINNIEIVDIFNIQYNKYNIRDITDINKKILCYPYVTPSYPNFCILPIVPDVIIEDKISIFDENNIYNFIEKNPINISLSFLWKFKPKGTLRNHCISRSRLKDCNFNKDEILTTSQNIIWILPFPLGIMKETDSDIIGEYLMNSLASFVVNPYKESMSLKAEFTNLKNTCNIVKRAEYNGPVWRHVKITLAFAAYIPKTKTANIGHNYIYIKDLEDALLNNIYSLDHDKDDFVISSYCFKSKGPLKFMSFLPGSLCKFDTKCIGFASLDFFNIPYTLFYPGIKDLFNDIDYFKVERYIDKLVMYKTDIISINVSSSSFIRTIWLQAYLNNIRDNSSNSQFPNRLIGSIMDGFYKCFCLFMDDKINWLLIWKYSASEWDSIIIWIHELAIYFYNKSENFELNQLDKFEYTTANSSAKLAKNLLEQFDIWIEKSCEDWHNDTSLPSYICFPENVWNILSEGISPISNLHSMMPIVNLIASTYTNIQVHTSKVASTQKESYNFQNSITDELLNFKRLKQEVSGKLLNILSRQKS